MVVLFAVGLILGQAVKFNVNADADNEFEDLPGPMPTLPL